MQTHLNFIDSIEPTTKEIPTQDSIETSFYNAQEPPNSGLCSPQNQENVGRVA